MGLDDCNPTAAPTEARLHLIKASTEALVDATEFRRVVGALRYLVHTRPNLAHSVSYVSRFMAEPHEDHQAAMKRILRYIAGTRDHGMNYARGKVRELLLLGYNDSDHGEDVEDSKRTSGILFYLGRSPITWQSQKQKFIALSFCEAEYMVSSVAACQAVWFTGLLAEILGESGRPPLLKFDNKSDIDLIRNLVHHGQRKHVRMGYHFMRECAAVGRIKIQFVGTSDQLADILTKPLPRNRFLEMKEKIGVARIK
jgi:hypothetical protein